MAKREKFVFDSEAAKARAVKVIEYEGGGHTYILDDYCKDKTDEEVQKIFDRVAQIALNAWREAGMFMMTREEYEKEQREKAEKEKANAP